MLLIRLDKFSVSRNNAGCANPPELFRTALRKGEMSRKRPVGWWRETPPESTPRVRLPPRPSSPYGTHAAWHAVCTHSVSRGQSSAATGFCFVAGRRCCATPILLGAWLCTSESDCRRDGSESRPVASGARLGLRCLVADWTGWGCARRGLATVLLLRPVCRGPRRKVL